MFSATFPTQMEALARRILKKPIAVQVGGRSVVCKDVEQHVAVLEEEAKFFKLLELLGNHQVSFIFNWDSSDGFCPIKPNNNLTFLIRTRRKTAALLCSLTNKKMRTFY